MSEFRGFKCDKCGKEFRYGGKDYDPVAIQITITFGHMSPSSYPSAQGYAVWCRECVMGTGFHKPVTDDDKKVAPVEPMTFEDQFAELIEQLGFVRE